MNQELPQGTTEQLLEAVKEATGNDSEKAHLVLAAVVGVLAGSPIAMTIFQTVVGVTRKERTTTGLRLCGELKEFLEKVDGYSQRKIEEHQRRN